MVTPVYPASNNQQAIDLNISNANQFFTILQGGIEDFIPTYEGNGEIPSVAKALNEAAAYKVPLAWQTTGDETDLLQPRIFNEDIYVPLTVPAPFSTAPSNEFWRLYSEKTAQVLIDTLTFTGDGFTTDFSIPSMVVDDPSAYLVSVDGVYQRPAIDYTVNVSTDTLSFTEAPPTTVADNISVTILGALRGALAEDIYETSADGLANTSDGQFFHVVNSTDPEAFIDLYKNNAGAALLIDTYPNSVAYTNLANAVAYEADLASNAVGDGSDLIAHTGTSDTVTVALNNRVIRVSSRTEMKAYDVSAGYQFSLDEGGRSGSFVVRDSSGAGFLIIKSVTSSSVDATTDTVTSTAHGLVNGDGVKPTASVNGLTAGQLYWVVGVTTDTFQLSLTYGGAAVDLTGTTNFTVDHMFDPLEGIYILLDNGNYVERQGVGKFIDAAWFGAVGDNSTLNRAPFKAAVDYASDLRYSYKSEVATFVTFQPVVTCPFGRYLFEGPIDNIPEQCAFDFKQAIFEPDSSYPLTEYLFQSPGNAGWRFKMENAVFHKFDYLVDFNNGNLARGMLIFDHVFTYGGELLFKIEAQSSKLIFNQCNFNEPKQLLNILRCDSAQIRDCWTVAGDGLPADSGFIELAADGGGQRLHVYGGFFTPPDDGLDKLTRSWFKLYGGYLQIEGSYFGGESGGLPLAQMDVGYATTFGRPTGIRVSASEVFANPSGYNAVNLIKIPNICIVENCHGFNNLNAIGWQDAVDPTLVDYPPEYERIQIRATGNIARYGITGIDVNRLPDELIKYKGTANDVVQKPDLMPSYSKVGEPLPLDGSGYPVATIPITADLGSNSFLNSPVLQFQYVTNTGSSALYSGRASGYIYFTQEYNGTDVVTKAIYQELFSRRGGSSNSTRADPIPISVRFSATGTDEILNDAADKTLEIEFQVGNESNRFEIKKVDQGSLLI